MQRVVEIPEKIGRERIEELARRIQEREFLLGDGSIESAQLWLIPLQFPRSYLRSQEICMNDLSAQPWGVGQSLAHGEMSGGSVREA